MATLHELITKVIPLKGILRIPSYWMRKVLTAIADAVEAVQTELRNADSELQSNLDAAKMELTNADKSLQLEKVNLDYNLDESSVILRNSKCIIKLTGTALVDGGVRAVVSSGTTSVTILSVKYIPTNGVVYAWIERGKTSLSLMFDGQSEIISIEFSGFDTSSVTDMSYMFRHCSSLTSLDLSSFDTSKVTDMSNMFPDCSSLTSLDLSSFDTSSVTDMSNMFLYCNRLTSLDVSNFNTSKVTDMGGMFISCTALRNIKCKQAFKDWCVANASTIGLTVANITWEIV